MAFPSMFYFSLSLLLLLLLLPFSVNSQSRRNVSQGSSLTAGSNDYWISPSGDFAFGFERVNNSTNGFLVAIVFDKMPERTVIWSANRNNLVPRGSTVQLNSGGLLILADPSGRQLWTPIQTPASYAAMLDTGNFVLAAGRSFNIWETFDVPTDTLLPTQIVNPGFQLISKYSRTNYSMGRFKFSLQPDGNVVQYTTTYPQMGNNFAYWASNTVASNWSSNSVPVGYSFIFNLSGFVYLASDNGSVLKTVFSNGESNQDFYQRVTLDFDGVLRYYVYPKGNGTSTTDSRGGNRWSSGWTTSYFQPLNLCIQVMGKTGSGACGYNSYCQLGNDQNPICRCPEGYVLLDPSDENKGCIQDFAPQDCRLDESDVFDLVVMPNADWVDGEYTSLESYTEDMCRQACLSDCQCDAAIYGRGSCWKKRMPLSNGRVDALVGVKALIKVRKSNSTSPLCPVSKKKKDKSALIIIGSVLLSTSGLINLLLLSAVTFLFLSKRRENRGNRIVAVNQEKDSLSTNLHKFSFIQLELATERFKEVLGSGASGTVYKGILPNKQLVDVKRLDKMVNKTQDQEFTTEVKVIGGTNHRNLVKLVGFCNEGQHRVLVYEFMSNGSLADLLFVDHSKPSWYTRTEIAYAVARGLVYLHDECSTQIIHCDIKPQNILLDESLTAKISDFGLAKLLKANQTKTMTLIRGTRGYVAPEWFKNMPITAKVDVHSFGILLLELVCCRKNLKMDAANEEEIILSDWAAECYIEGKLQKLVEDDKEAIGDIGKVERFVKIALWCLQDDPYLRPGMKKVVQMLEGSVPVSAPPDPASFIS
ncbi:G-type lectin S-receptor-like serine/threonine-protein kinase LECRK3, partial [Linum perenne]